MTRNLSLGLALLAFFLVAPAVLAEPIPVTGRVAGLPARPLAVALEWISLSRSSPDPPLSAGTLQSGGEFRVSAPEPGFWRLVARAPGAAPAAFDLLPLMEPAALPPLQLVAARRIQVRVTDSAGSPLSGATVRIESPGPEERAAGWFPGPAAATTGQDGSALLEVSPAARLLLTVAKPGFLPERQEIPSTTAAGVELRLHPGVARILEATSPKGLPVSGVTVTTEAEWILGTTDGAGRLPLVAREAGETPLRLLAPDCRWATGALRRDSASRFVLKPPRALQGSVLDRQTRQPLAGAWVWVEGLPACSARTQKEGRYQLALPDFGGLRLRAAAPGYRPEALAFASSRAAEAPILALSPVVERLSLAGRVVDPAGDPLAEAGVQALSAAGPAPGDGGPGARREAVTESDGAFVLSGFRAGEVLTLRVAKRGFAVVTVPNLQAGLREPLTVVLTRAARIAGTVAGESGSPIAGAKLLLFEGLEEGGETARPSRLAGGAETDREGRFELTDLSPGGYRLAAVNAGFLPQTRGGLTLQAGRSIEGVDLVLRRGATIEGTISTPDGSPAAGAKVIVLDAGQESSLGMAGRLEAQADGEGRYEIGGVLEGDRTVYAELRGFQPARGPIRVEAGANRLDLRLRQGFEISGRVSSREGPVPGAVLQLQPQQEGSTPPPPSSTAADGAFRFQAVAEGRYRVSVEKPGFAMSSAPLEVQVAGAPVENLEVRLERGGAIAGRIRGLVPDDLARVQVVATAPGQAGQAGSVDAEGRYRIEGLGPGEWTVLASLPEGSRAAGSATLDAAKAETLLDLEFVTGFVLSGRVERKGATVAGALVLVEGADGGGGDAVTGQDGRFRLERLRPGSYGVTALDPRSHARLDLRLEINGDREIVLALPAPVEAGPQTQGRQ